MPTTTTPSGAETRLPEGWSVRRIGWPGAATHPVLKALSAAQWALWAAETAPVWSMTPAQTATTIDSAHRLSTQVAAARLRVLAHGATVKVEEITGAVSTAAYVAHTTRTTRAAAHREVKLASDLAERYPDLAAALTTGRVNLEQTQTIAKALGALPEDLDAHYRCLAETTLIDHAEDYDAKTLEVLGRRILDVIAPEIGEAEEAKRIAAAEAAAEKKKRFTMVDDGHGSAHGRFTIPTHVGDKLRKHLMALTSPARRHGDDKPWAKPTPERLGEAFCEYVERYPLEQTPDAGGTSATVVVTIDLDTLLSGLGVATLDSGSRITAGEARRLACLAGIVPAVMDGTSQPLDLGRARRFFNKIQRIALGLRDQHCTTEGCDRPAAWCEAHHDDPWACGGRTDLEDGRLLCRHHHQCVHDPTYDVIHLEPDKPGGKIRFQRRV